jgi:uncharacterized protein
MEEHARMHVDLYAGSVGVFGRGLGGLAAVLRKAEAHVAATPLSEAELLHARLYPNMYPFYRQVQIACNFAHEAPARIAELPIPGSIDQETSFAELTRNLSQVRAFLKTLSPEQLADRDTQPITFPVGAETMTLPVSQYVLGFAVPNFYFHNVTAYAILRSIGVDLGKRDYFGMGPA